MEAQPSSSGPSAAADYPRWVLLDGVSLWQDPSAGDASTLVSCYGSTGRPVQVSFRIAPPPAVSTLHVRVAQQPPLRGGEVNETAYQDVLAAHGDSVLINLSYGHDYFSHDRQQPNDYFVYSAGDGAGARPPSLSLLPPPPAKSYLERRGTGILRRAGGDEFVVAKLGLSHKNGDTVEAKLLVLRSGDCAWELSGVVPVLHADGQEENLSGESIDAVIPVGDRFLYWIYLGRGVVFSDVTAASPELRYVPLPVDHLIACGDGPPYAERPDASASENVCVTGGGETVKFVRVSPRCCCGGPGRTGCARSRRAFTITTWTLRTDGTAPAWEEDSVLDSDELWAAASVDIPRVPLVYPVVSIDDPDVVFFLSSEYKFKYRHAAVGDKTLWVVAVDTRRKTLRSVRHYPEEDDEEGRNGSWLHEAFLPSEVSGYFNTTRHGGGGDTPASREDIEAPAPAAGAADRTLLKASPDGEDREILALIQEIPRMARDEMLRARSLLAGDDRRLRFLVGLPAGMRKEYCMLELERNLLLPNNAITSSHQNL